MTEQRGGARPEDGSANRLKNLWDKQKAAGMTEPERLIYRSNLLGSDKRITNYGGGNTSAKVMEKDPLSGETVEVMWVKGSGGDVGTIRRDGFATLYMDKLRARSTRRSTPMCRVSMSITCIPTRSSRSRPRRIPGI